jgi:hypothetical protein
MPVKEVVSLHLDGHNLCSDLFNQPAIERRLKKMWPEDLIR